MRTYSGSYQQHESMHRFTAAANSSEEENTKAHARDGVARHVEDKVSHLEVIASRLVLAQFLRAFPQELSHQFAWTASPKTVKDSIILGMKCCWILRFDGQLQSSE
jgi:hypothetical protein